MRSVLLICSKSANLEEFLFELPPSAEMFYQYIRAIYFPKNFSRALEYSRNFFFSNMLKVEMVCEILHVFRTFFWFEEGVPI